MVSGMQVSVTRFMPRSYSARSSATESSRQEGMISYSLLASRLKTSSSRLAPVQEMACTFPSRIMRARMIPSSPVDMAPARVIIILPPLVQVLLVRACGPHHLPGVEVEVVLVHEVADGAQSGLPAGVLT